MVDKDENEIGKTYPKRAKGLVKKGRAEYAGDRKIRLLELTHVPTVNNETEDIKMSNIINFNAGDFSFNKKCWSNQGYKGFITNSFGENIEMFEIGDWNWNWTSIISKQQLEKNTDYVFRFGVTMGNNDTQDEVLRFYIRFDGDEENQTIYVLERGRYKPVISKKLGETILRIYEIKFNTGGAENVEFLFDAMRAVTQIIPVKECSAYNELEDLSYGDWWQTRKNEILKVGGNVINLQDANISLKVLRKLKKALPKTGDYVLNLQGANIFDDKDDKDDNE